MQKCRDCNFTIKTGEVACYNCGAPVQIVDTPQTLFVKRFVSFLNVAFFGSAILTVVSLFTDFTPPFMRCLMLTLILLVIRSSATQMMEKKRG